jgi:hypothetical protein
MATTVTPDAVEKVVFDALPQFGADPSEISREATFEDLDVSPSCRRSSRTSSASSSRATTSARSRPSATPSTWW